MSGSGESKKQLGKILLQQRLVSADSLQEMLEDQKRDPGSRLASTAARTGRLSMTDALRALSEQHAIPGIDLTEQIVQLAILRLVPIELARERFVFPFRFDGDELRLAMSSPQERELIEELEFLTGKKIRPFVGLHEVIRRVIDYAYAALDRGQEYYVGAHVSDAQLRAHGLPDLPRAPEPLSAYPPPLGAPAPIAPEVAAARAVAGPSEAVNKAPNGPLKQPAAIAAPAPAGAQPRPSVAVVPAVVVSRSSSEVMPEAPVAAGPALVAPPPAANTVEAKAVPPALDVAFAQRPTHSQPPQTHKAEAGARVLLAIADAAVRAAVARALEPSGASVLQTDGGEEVLALLDAEPPSVLVLSASLHGIQGLDVCHRLRFGLPDATPPIVVLSDAFGGWRLAADLSQSLGIAHCFEPPFDAQRLAEVVRSLLDGQTAAEEPPPLSPAAEANWNGGMEAFERGDLTAAIERLEAGVAIDPHAFDLQYHLGLLYGRREELFRAIRALEIAVRLQPRHFSAIKNLAVVYQRVGFRYKALDAWERAKTAAPDDETRTNIKQHMISLL